MKSKIQTSLLNWYKLNARPLPWRRTKDPYKIWVSEIMLQQTQVDTVIPYYERWMETFPTLEKLASSPVERVLKLWEGLGYYSRAQNLHKAAKRVREHHDGRVPDSFEEISELSGIGRYTAGAILSIAFQKPYPVVDGNVQRVLSRLFAIEKDISSTETQQELWETAQELLHTEKPGDFNQALMELGALICTPKSPECLLCPVVHFCQARKKGIQESLPIKIAKVKVQSLEKAVALIEDAKGRFLIQQRPSKGLLAGLWEFPEVVKKGKTKLQEALKNDLKKNYGIQTELAGALPSVFHLYTHRRMVFYPFWMRLEKGKVRDFGQKLEWIKPHEAEKYAFSVAHQKIIRLLIEKRKSKEKQLTLA